MNELRKNHIKFLTIIFVNLAFYALTFYAFIYFGRILDDINYNYVWTLGFVILLIWTVQTFMFRNRIWVVVNEKYRIKIASNLGDPLPIKRLRTKESLSRYLLNNDYKLFSQDPSHQTFYKVEKNKVRKMFGGYILKVVVYISKNEEEFYLQVVDEDINRIQDLLQTERKKVQNFLITQIKTIDQLDDNTKKLIKETFFFKTQNSVISTINIALHQESEKAVMFYSDKFSPSLYYTEQIDEIKKMV
jgi:hypothetical protein